MVAIPAVIPSILSRKFMAFISPTIQSIKIGTEMYHAPNTVVTPVPSIKVKAIAVWIVNFMYGLIPKMSSIIPKPEIKIVPRKKKNSCLLKSGIIGLPRIADMRKVIIIPTSIEMPPSSGVGVVWNFLSSGLSMKFNLIAALFTRNVKKYTNKHENAKTIK
jgi:hypothetical protein